MTIEELMTKQYARVFVNLLELERYFENPRTDEEESAFIDFMRTLDFTVTNQTETGATGIVQTRDDIDEDEPVYYHFCVVYHKGNDYLLMTHCPENMMFIREPGKPIREYDPAVDNV